MSPVAGALTKEAYPSGRVVQTDYDGARRSNGQSRPHADQLRDRNQSLPQIGQTFSYDSLNRLTGVSDSGYSRGFSYDPYGNMWVNLAGTSVITPAGNTPTSNVYNGANQISGANYDAAGNLQSANGFWITYDAENRQAQVADIPALGGGTETLVYDGLGQRVQKILPSSTTVYVYDAFGQLAAEYSTSPRTSAPCSRCYLSYDHLGSLRLVTDQYTNVIARHDYLPFGEEIPGGSAGRGSLWGAPDGVTQRFTGQTRDSETGVDYFNARYFTGALGRFNSADPANAGADMTDPQTWNGYAYVGNNPMNAVDPSGACDVAIYGIRMNPGESTLVSNFSANKIAVFPYEGTNIATGVGQVIGGGGDVNAAIQGIRSAIAQTPAGQSVNIFTFSGGTQTLASAWGSLTSAEQSRVGNITYSIPGSATGALPRGSNNPMMIFPNGSHEIPSGALSDPYSVAWATSCGHDVNCNLKVKAALLQQQSGSSCSTPQVIPAPQSQAPGNKGSKGGGGVANSKIIYGQTVGGWDIFDLLRFLFPPASPPPFEM